MMKRHALTRIWQVAMLAGLPVLFAAGAGHAQQSAPPQQPARNGSVWNGQRHQPTAGEVSGEEQGTGLAPTRQHRDATDQELDQLSRKLMDQSHSELGTGPAGNSGQ